MRSFIAKRFETRPAGLSLDTEALARYADVIDLSIGDTDFTTDKRIIDAAYADALNGYTHYGDPKGDPELVDAVIQAWKEDFGQDIPREEVLVTTSSSIGMAQALLGIVNPGDEVIVLAPYFASYAQQIELAGGVVVEVPTYEENAYRPDEQELRRVITSRTRAIIINTPCNPTGAAYDRDTLEMLAGIAKEFDLLVLADEIYTRYLYEGEFIPMRTLPGMAERTVTLNSFSKNFLMTGWRVGVVIAPAELISVFQFISNALTYTAPSISQRAAIRALALRHQIAEEYIMQISGSSILCIRMHRKAALHDPAAAPGHVLSVPRHCQDRHDRRPILSVPFGKGPYSGRARKRIRQGRAGTFPHCLHRFG